MYSSTKTYISINQFYQNQIRNIRKGFYSPFYNSYMPSSTRFFHARSTTRTRSTALIACFLIGSLAFILGLIAISRQNLGGGGYKCANVKPRSVSVVWDKHQDDVVNHNSRHKSMGFVGIQTGFASANRRKSLRQTWMPSDRQSLQRLIYIPNVYAQCLIHYFIFNFNLL